jgi:protein-tyrosine phosphatase
MAEVVLAQMVSDNPLLRSTVEVSSAGTANWHVGKEMDERARAALNRAGFLGAGSRAAFADSTYLDSLDVIVVMTREHRADVLARCTRHDTELVLLRSLLQSDHDLDLADPYYGNSDDFDECLDSVIRACQELVPRLRLVGETFEA